MNDIPIIIIPRGAAKYFCVFLGSILVFSGISMALQSPPRPPNYMRLTVIVLVIGLGNVIIGVLDFPQFRRFMMNKLRPMPFENCPICEEKDITVFVDSLRTEGGCIFCKAKWSFKYSWWLGRKIKWIMLKQVDRKLQKTELLGMKLPLSFWLIMANSNDSAHPRTSKVVGGGRDGAPN